MKTMNPIEAAAADFARHTKGGGGWALGLEVASCVQPGTGNGRPPKETSAIAEVSKVSAVRFAEMAGTGDKRVARYLQAWNRAAEAGLVNPAHELTPADWNDPDQLPEGYDWSEFYDGGQSGTPRAKADPVEAVAELIRRDGPEAIAEAMVKSSPVAAALVESKVRTDRIRDYPAPFDTPPQPYPGADKATRWMDLTPTITRLHSAILDLSDFQRENPDVIVNYTDELQHEHDLLGAVIALARGISDADLVKLLDGAR